VRGDQVRHVAVSDTISNRRQLLNFRVHAGTLARSTRPEPGSGFEPGSRVSTVVALPKELSNLVQRTNQVRTDLLAHSLRVCSRTLAQARVSILGPLSRPLSTVRAKLRHGELERRDAVERSP
jgi:hypothetical protein